MPAVRCLEPLFLEAAVDAKKGIDLRTDDTAIKNLLESMRRIAGVGISAKEDRASHGIAKFLIGQGFEVVGVNPTLDEVQGVPVYPSLTEVPGTNDLVDIFRRSDAVPPIVDEAIARSVGAIWMQEDVISEESAAKAQAAGIDTVMDRCIYKDWLRLMNT
jgi:predicted CoA-binding protein